MNKFPFIKSIIIDCLLKSDGLTGYDLIKFCRGNGIHASSGNVYPHLKSLEESGIIEHREDGRRKLYRLTPNGKKQAKATALDSAPDFLKNIFFKSLSLAAYMNWSNKKEVQMLIENVNEIKKYLSEYLEQLS
jgi:DNA-binding PadR family transcriptional regulator